MNLTQTPARENKHLKGVKLLTQNLKAHVTTCPDILLNVTQHIKLLDWKVINDTEKNDINQYIYAPI